MDPQVLPHYMRMYRKTSGLSQTDLAMLLGQPSSNKMSQIEHDNHMPSLETAISLAVIFNIKMITLFPGIFEQAHKRVCSNAKGEYQRTKKMIDQYSSPRDRKRAESLRKIAQGTNVII